MNKTLKYGILITIGLSVALAIAYTIFIHTFDLFGDPEKVIVDAKCNPEKTLQATTYTLSGNAVTERSIIVSVRSECGRKSRKLDDYIVFAAEFRMGSVLTKWLSDDTLEILYSHHIEPIDPRNEFHLANEEFKITVLNRDKIESSDLIGKWYSFNRDEGYNEFNIDASEIHVFSHYMGNRPTIQYLIEKNKLFYPEYDFVAEMHLLSDSTLCLKSEHRKDTLHLMPMSTITFDEINSKDDSVFADFYSDYELRAINSWIKHGYITEEEFEEFMADTSGFSEDELLLINRDNYEVDDDK